MPTPTRRARPVRREWLLAVLLSCLVLVSYAPVLSAGYIWDDDAYVAKNANLENLAGLKRIWFDPLSSPQYYPLVFTTFWLERQAFGPGPLSGHAVNVALHAVIALMLWRLLRRLEVPGAFVAAAIFAVHPVHVESVAWITERKNVLSGACYLAAAWTYLSWALPCAPDEKHATGRRRVVYAASLLLFVGALLAKSVTATLPLALLIVLWWKRGRIGWKDVVPLMPFILLGGVMGLLTAWLERHHVGALGEAWQLSVLERVLVAGRAVWFYAGKLVWPHPLVFVYPRWRIDSGQPTLYVFPAAAIALVAACWFARRRVGRGPLAAVLFFLVSLLPALGFFNVYPMRYSFVADHFQYLASLGIITLVVACLAAACVRAGTPRVGQALAAGALVALVVTTRVETRKYADAEALWLDTLAKNPGAWLASNNLGTLRMAQGRYPEARALLQDAIRANTALAEAHNNLGTVWFREGHTDAAMREHQAAITLDPGYAEACNNLGVDLAARGRDDEAIRHYRRALEIDPAYAQAHGNLANALVRLGRHDEAEVHFREALRLRPDFSLAHFGYGVDLLTRGRAAEAQTHLDAAFRLKPDFAFGHYQVGTIQLGHGDADAAIESFRQAIALKPDYVEAHNNLGSALMTQGRIAEAAVCFEQAVRLSPRYALAHNNLGFALEQQGRIEAARAQYVEALRLDSGNARARANLERLEGRGKRGAPQ